MERQVSVGAAFLSEFDHEQAKTRRVLERVPEGKLTWRPHSKSWTMGELATHLTNLFNWAVITLETDSLDLGAGGGAPPRREPAGSRQDLLEAFDRNVAAARSAIAACGDERLLQPWTLLHTGRPQFTMPRIAVLRDSVLHHAIHHRAQLCLYLRLNDVPVPGMFGPTADEAGM